LYAMLLDQYGKVTLDIREKLDNIDHLRVWALFSRLS